MDVVEDYRLVVVPSRLGWRAYLVMDDGVELVEDVNLVGDAGSSSPARP